MAGQDPVDEGLGCWEAVELVAGQVLAVEVGGDGRRSGVGRCAAVDEEVAGGSADGDVLGLDLVGVPLVEFLEVCEPCLVLGQVDVVEFGWDFVLAQLEGPGLHVFQLVVPTVIGGVAGGMKVLIGLIGCDERVVAGRDAFSVGESELAVLAPRVVVVVMAAGEVVAGGVGGELAGPGDVPLGEGRSWPPVGGVAEGRVRLVRVVARGEGHVALAIAAAMLWKSASSSSVGPYISA